jgi:cytochrome c peroxidase
MPPRPGFPAALVGVALAVAGAAAPARAHFGPMPVPLRGVPVPEVPGLVDGPDPIVVDREKAIALGKALFWDVNVGSDGVACATCHFHAGADGRVKNQLAPQGKAALVHAPLFEPAPGAGPRGPNSRLQRADFPFHRTSRPLDPLGTVTWSSDDVAGSAGGFGGAFASVSPIGDADDRCERAPDALFRVGATGVRRVEARNAPTVINAVFQFRTLWDGAANNVFNGSSPWGDRDPDAGVWVRTGPTSVARQRLDLPNSALASQALMPVLDEVEMSCGGRTFADLGRKLACRAPLEGQAVHWEDSVLGPLANSTPGQLRRGLATSYEALVREAFAPRFWSHPERGAFGAPAGAGALPYSQLEANFAMFFALSLQLYQSTLISDDSPFDRSRRNAEGVPIDLSAAARRGIEEFRVAHCNLCHVGPLFTAAAVVPNAILVESDPLAFGNETFAISTTRNVVTRTSVQGGPAVIDTGFASNGVTPEAWDVGLGGRDPFGHPLSFADQYLQWLAGNPAGVVDPHVDAVRACDLDLPIATNAAAPHPAYFTAADGVLPQPQGTAGCFAPAGAFVPHPAVAAAELASPTNTKMRSAASGSFKIPTLRNVELTGPYMHNGSMATLEEVVEFYTRGGNFAPAAKHFGTVFPQVDLRLSATRRRDLVAFLETLTDDRVRYERAPFDHPELPLPHGHAGDAAAVEAGHRLGADLARDERAVIPAVGAGGRATPLPSFATLLAEGLPTASLAPGPDAGAPGLCLVPEPTCGAPAAIAALALLGRRRDRRTAPGRGYMQS